MVQERPQTQLRQEKKVTPFHRCSSLLCLAAICALPACADPPPPKTPEKPVTKPVKVDKDTSDKDKGDDKKVDKDPNATPVAIDSRIKEMCKLPEARFDFDSARLGSGAQNMLNALASCFLEGKGKGKNMNIVGHTDPRGPKDYNLALGHKRAAAVAGYLATKGLKDDRVDTSSRGEEEATGTEESGWSVDRKVEILLAEDE